MEKFIKDYGILIIGAVAVYWFFIREKDEEEVLVVNEDGSNYTMGRRVTGPEAQGFRRWWSSVKNRVNRAKF